MPDQANGLLSPWLRSRRIQAVLPFLGGNILDFGCGAGSLAEHIPNERYWGTDRDAESLAVARERHPNHQFSQELPVNQTFETVVALAVIEHMSDPSHFLRMLRSRLKENGQIVVTTPHPAWHKPYEFGARLGLFSHHAHQEHEKLLGRNDLIELSNQSGLRILNYRRFLFGANQLAVMKASQ